jgi:VNT family MFS transporter (synaptic vesicle glycoprotein 2)
MRRGEKPTLMYGSDSPPPAPVSPDEEGAPLPQPERISVDSELNHIGFGRFQALALATLGLANAADAVELLCLSFILPVLDGSSAADRCGGGDSVDPGSKDGYTKSAKAVLSAAIFVGMLVGGLVFGAASDKWGRRRVLSIALGINAVFGLLSAATSSYATLLVCRVVAGFGVGGSIPGVFSMAAEVLPAKNRGFWLSTVAWWWMVVRAARAQLAARSTISPPPPPHSTPSPHPPAPPPARAPFTRRGPLG